MAPLLEANAEEVEATVAETLAAHSFGIQQPLLEATSDPSKVLQDPHQSQYYIFYYIFFWIPSLVEQLCKVIEMNYLRGGSIRGVGALCVITNGLQRRVLEQGLPNFSLQRPPQTALASGYVDWQAII